MVDKAHVIIDSFHAGPCVVCHIDTYRGIYKGSLVEDPNFSIPPPDFYLCMRCHKIVTRSMPSVDNPCFASTLKE